MCEVAAVQLHVGGLLSGDQRRHRRWDVSSRAASVLTVTDSIDESDRQRDIDIGLGIDVDLHATHVKVLKPAASTVISKSPIGMLDTT